ncbi:MAG: transporter related [Clostridiales bacterium]|jgi:ABC-2 type transport system ATP-binding protein|nr:transporter related [Clostridiales bacterium]
MTSVIEVRDLKRDYIATKGWVRRRKETIKAVDGISFDVHKGEIFGLLGQNGAGKTTTIKMLITLLAPTSGTCKVLGYDTFGEEKEIRNRINFIFGGEMGVYRRLSARDNLKYFANLYLIKTEAIHTRITELLDLVGLTDKADLLVETYSKGMIQRLQIARGLINDPEIIFMDEPTVGLDPLGARMLRDIIKKLKEQGKTVLLTTHYMYEADELCDRIAIINKGQLIALDTPEKLKHRAKGSDSIEVIVDNLTDELLEKIKSIHSVTAVATSSNEKGIAVCIQCGSALDISGKVLSIFKNNKIYAFTQKEITLEDVYIQLVEGVQ